jgi:2-iminobutanoate/2-iminopropanoate deaminase
MKKTILTKDAPAPIGPYSQAVESNGTLYISGQIPMDPYTGEMISGDIKNETNQVMKNISAILETANMKMSDIDKCSIFISDMNDFQDINEIYGTYFNESPPARETVEVSRLPKDVRVEISAIAST